MGYSRLVKWIDWQAMKHGAPIVIVDPRKTSSECPNCDSKLEENGYRRLRCPRCGFEEDRDVIGKLNIRKKALKMLGDQTKLRGSSGPPHCPPNDRCKPE
jgi:putative transposase